MLYFLSAVIVVLTIWRPSKLKQSWAFICLWLIFTVDFIFVINYCKWIIKITKYKTILINIIFVWHCLDTHLLYWKHKLHSCKGKTNETIFQRPPRPVIVFRWQRQTTSLFNSDWRFPISLFLSRGLALSPNSRLEVVAAKHRFFPAKSLSENSGRYVYRTTRPLTSLLCPGRDPNSDGQHHGRCRPLFWHEEWWQLCSSRFLTFHWATWAFVLDFF